MWGVMIRRSDKCIDGERSYMASILPWAFHGPAIFHTRREARAWIREHHGYIQQRPDLRAAPHGWLAPLAVKVKPPTVVPYG